MGRACRHCFPARAAAMCSLLAVREKLEGGRRKEKGEEKENEGKEKGKKEKNMKIFLNLKISEK
jgi:hypothetical protein